MIHVPYSMCCLRNRDKFKNAIWLGSVNKKAELNVANSKNYWFPHHVTEQDYEVE